ncbi:MAG: 6-phosphogluconolactonase [Phycisphaerales bacterium]
MPNVAHTYVDAPAAAHACADRVAHLLREMIGARGAAHLALSGGNTPKPMYAILAALPDIDWQRVHFWWGDERCVAQNDKDSNQRMARETLLSRIPVNDQLIHWVPTTLEPAQCAAAYEAELRRACDIDPKSGMPIIDILLLGLGDDGHTLSLFPGSPTLQESSKAVVSTIAPPTSPVKDRVTLTYPAARAARYRIFLAGGAKKRSIIDACVKGTGGYPAAAIDAAEWFVDEAAD